MTLIEQRLGIKAVTIPGTTGQFEVIVNGQRIAERGGNWFTRAFGAGYPDLEHVVEQLEKHRDAARVRHTISFIDTAAIEIDRTDGWILSFTLPEGCSIPEEFKVGSEIAIMVYPADRLNKISYCEIRHVASKKVIKAFCRGERHR